MNDETIKRAIETAHYRASAEMLAEVKALLASQLTPSLIARAHARLMRKQAPLELKAS